MIKPIIPQSLCKPAPLIPAPDAKPAPLCGAERASLARLAESAPAPAFIADCYIIRKNITESKFHSETKSLIRVIDSFGNIRTFNKLKSYVSGGYAYDSFAQSKANSEKPGGRFSHISLGEKGKYSAWQSAPQLRFDIAAMRLRQEDDAKQAESDKAGRKIAESISALIMPALKSSYHHISPDELARLESALKALSPIAE